ncbi:DUF922 domain-containing protein [Segetibacter aerophilus]|uniref:DUF922 domain-containing protein n=1 Tax=Segetibacter aerophilus TaxID=670293 RepID=A0A512BJP1_9BACT|nr:DUF922 domain-containing protein [Segetibacter aerophilus]GEO12190.1 hypothetical protein SAE01_46860 [Segetibacter aerophilus]
MKTVLIIVILFITTAAHSQESIRWSGNQQLKWEDFLGRVNDTSRYDAECYAEIRYNYKIYSEGDFEFEVFANFDKNTSWSRRHKQSDDLLKHEQLHFDIAELFAQKLKREFDSYTYTASTYNTQIIDLFNQKKLEYQAMQRQYDEETNHSLNKAKQKQWDDFIYLELRKLRLSLQLAQNNKKDTGKAE